MKKILAFTLSSIFILAGSAAFAACSASDAPQAEVYLAPGTYISDGEKVENTVPSGATKLTEAQCAEMYTENLYLCNVEAGKNLPVPVSGRVDNDGNAYTFNGWWTIVNATVTYFETVPEVTETTFLYADWRADLSQRKDPVIPDESTMVKPLHYMSVKRAETGETDIITLRVSGTDASTAESLGYGAPVQLYNEWFELFEGDVITVYTVGLGSSEEAQIAPVPTNGSFTITLENSTAEGNDTKNYLKQTSTTSKTVTYKATASHHFRIYIKFYNNGSVMTIYMQPQD